MTDTPLDPRRDALISALYGELSEEEERSFRLLLAEDPDLRADREDLEEARAFLKSDVPSPSPGFVFMAPAAASGRAAARVPVRASGVLARLRARLLTPAGAFAATAVAAVILILAGFRVDRTGSSVTLGFGPSPESFPSGTTLSSQDRLPSPADPSLDPASAPFGFTSSRGGGSAEPGSYLTRAEYMNYSNELMLLLTAMLNRRDERRSGELALMLQGFYDEMMQRQRREYADLRSQIERVSYGIPVGNAALESLIKKGERYELTPVHETANQKEGGSNE